MLDKGKEEVEEGEFFEESLSRVVDASSHGPRTFGRWEKRQPTIEEVRAGMRKVEQALDACACERDVQVGICIIPPHSSWEQIQTIRSKHDRHHLR